MPLTVLTGRPSAPVTAVVYDAVRDAVCAGRSTVLLLPTLPDVRRARRALAASCPIGLDVSELDRVVETLWALHGDGRRPVGATERRLLLRAAWADVAEGRPDGDGTLALLGTLARRASEREPVSAPVAHGSEAALLVDALSHYRELLGHAGLVEEGEAVRLLARGAPAPGELVAVHRFTDLGPAQEAMLRAWAESADVVLTLPYDPGVSATESIASLVARFAEAGADVREVAGPGPVAAELDALERRLFAPGDTVAAAGAVSLAVAQGAEGEARLAVRHVARALADGTPADRIAVAFRDPARHYPWLRRVLEEHGIAADYDVALPAGETPLGRAVMHLWRFATAGHTRIDLEAFLRSPYAATPTAAVDAANEEWRSSRTPDGPGLLEAVRADAPGHELVTDMLALARAPLDRTAAANWQILADRMLANGHPADGAVSDGETLLDAATQRALVAAVDVLSAIDGSSAADAIAALHETPVSQSVLERPGHVQVMGVERLRSRRFDVVVLGGLTASEFPRRGVGDSLEGDVVRSAMDALGLEHDQADELARERLLFYLAVTRARTALALLRRSSDDEGRELRRSVFWDELLDLYRDPVDPEDRRGPEIERLGVEQMAGVETAGAAPCAARGRLADRRTLEALSAIDVVSASDIEAYLSCPYAWYVERVLRPSRPDADIGPRTRGVIAHEAIRLFYDSLRPATGERRVTPSNLSVALDLVPSAVAAALDKAPVARTLEEGQAIGAVERQVRRLVERDAHFLADYEPLAHEWVFGRADEEPVDLGSFRLKGRADRIDVGPEGLVVIDYKGSAATPVARFRDEGLVQLQLYAIAAGRRFGRRVAGGLYRSLSVPKDRGFVHAAVAGPGIVRTDRLDAGEIDALLDDAVARSAAAVGGMRDGRIGPRPEQRRCSYCIASGFCAEAAR